MYYVYIMTNKGNSVLYAGITNSLYRRIKEYANDNGSVFTRKYNIHKLVWFEKFPDVRYAIAREKQIKGWLRVRKIELI